jgi:putative sigma-54 modulation protein
MDKLDQYCNSIIKTDVFLKCNNSKSKTNKTVEVKLSVPGNNLVVKKVSATFESAVLMAVNSMQRKLKKYKYKLR